MTQHYNHPFSCGHIKETSFIHLNQLTTHNYTVHTWDTPSISFVDGVKVLFGLFFRPQNNTHVSRYIASSMYLLSLYQYYVHIHCIIHTYTSYFIHISDFTSAKCMQNIASRALTTRHSLHYPLKREKILAHASYNYHNTCIILSTVKYTYLQV